MLEVVEHEQRRALAQIIDELVLGGEAAVGGVDRELDCVGDRRGQEVGRGDGGQGDEVHSMGVAIEAAGGGLEGQPCLPDASGADERQQAAVRIGEAVFDLLQLAAPPDE